ncbi:glutathione S-transferase [Pseudomonas syringae pv. tomato]|uniref:Glutathione S-transferase family protein n=6 Tax=Pseudomonas syringae group TaxID=136849 RepID=A0AAW4DU34_PSESX|nr:MULTISPECIES: glutathione S-transferase family protein [Pseudomonas]AVI82698.1 glutathione S-transferase [Pseudomonas syringae pv. tomato]KGK96520.1 glutathione S-transferase [Pseudomonas syringae pv. tomato]KKI24052.1 glutathione S-transferase [Pseudomonas syringae pv. persicae]KPB84182.1 Glutathione S-transferase domain-containing protein [Pseudomonas syringae pv. maculicola]KPB93067.1 Glutathione S-transferase domain-containing protein [Pseudomonas syringae pv. maculicola]
MSAPTMTLYFNAASPFARKVMVMLHETGQLDRVQLQPTVLTPVSPSAELNEDNPAGKLPALRLADGNVIHDSRVILDYLDHQHVGQPLIPREGSARWRRLTLASLADAVLDAAVLIRYETALRPQEKHWDQWLDNQQQKIERSLSYFERDAITELSSSFDVASISVAAALGYLDFRQPELRWRNTYPRLANWYLEVSQRPSMLATQPPA